MIGRLKSLLAARPDQRGEAGGEAELRRSVAALLFMAAQMDDRIDATERAVIADAVAARFALPADEAAALLAEAEREAQDATHFQRFTAEIKQAYDDAERLRVMEMLWQVVCADGVVHDREANLMRRIAGLLYVTDKDSGLARQRALASADAARTRT
ncbi:MAG: TerB family tellurite resistance protein [Alphaproteobacteria bacterium]